MSVFTAPWLQPTDVLGAIRGGTSEALSISQMLQDAKDKAAALALQRSELAARGDQQNADRAQRGSEESAANALRYAQLKQEGVLGTQKLQNQATALDQREGNLTAREALDNAKAEALQRQKPIFSNTGGGLMQFDENTGKWGLVPGSSKAAPRQSEGTVKVPMDPAHPEQGSIDVPINSPAYQKWNSLKSTVTPTAAVPAVPDSRFLGIPIPFTGTAAKPAGSVTNNPPSLSQFMQSSQNNVGADGSAAAALNPPANPLTQLPARIPKINGRPVVTPPLGGTIGGQPVDMSARQISYNAPAATDSAAPQIPQAHIDYLNAHPETANDFQSKYGVDPLNYITNAAPAAPSQSDTDSE